MEPVRSRQNRKVVEAARLLRARSDDETLLQGEKLVEEAIAAGTVIERLFVLAGTDHGRWRSANEVVAVTEPVMKRLTPTGDIWGPVAIVRIPSRSPRTTHPVLVAVDIADPGNLGTMIRSAAAFGYDVVCVRGTDPWSPKTLRSAAGGHFRSHVSQSDTVPERQLVAAVVAGGAAPASLQLDADHALLIGSEAKGLSDDQVAMADLTVSIPMQETESLNAAMAASVLMYEFCHGNSAGRSAAQD